MAKTHEGELRTVVADYLRLLQRLQQEGKVSRELADALLNVKGSTGP